MDDKGRVHDAGAAEGKQKGEAYSYGDQELIRQLVKSRMAQRSELEYECLDGYMLPPRTQFSMLNKPAVSIRYGRMTFNMACIRLFESVEFILPLVHLGKKRLTVVMCAEEESASVAWARKRQKDAAWVNRDITSEDFIFNLYKMMGWKNDCRYKVLGRVANSSQGLVLVFEMDEAIMFASKPVEVVNKETGEVKKKQVRYYPDAYKDCIGRSYNDYVEARQMNMFEYLEEYMGQTYSDKQTGIAGEAGETTVQGSHGREEADRGGTGELHAAQGLKDGGGSYE